MRVLRRLSMLVTAVLAAAMVGVPAAAASRPELGPYAVPAAGTFYPTAAQRLLGEPARGYAVPAGGMVTVPVAGRQGLPASGISAALVNVTASAAGADVALTTAETGRPRPESTLLTVPALGTRSSLLTVPLGAAAGTFDLYVTGGTATVVADLLGFYAADDTVVATRGLSGGYQPVAPVRLYDSRPDRGGRGAVAAGDPTRLSVDLGGESVNSHATALVLQVTAVSPSRPGSLTVSATGPTPDLASVSFSAGAPATNLALVPAELDGDGRLEVAVTNRSDAPADVVVDLLGFYDDGSLGPNLRFRSLKPTRVLAAPGRQPAQLPAGADETVDPPETVAGDNTFALAGVLTVRASAVGTELVVGPGSHAPGGSMAGGAGLGELGSIPVGASATTSAPVQPQVDASGTLHLRSSAAAEVTLDVVGSFEAYPAVTDPATRAWVPAVSAWQVGAVAR